MQQSSDSELEFEGSGTTGGDQASAVSTPSRTKGRFSKSPKSTPKLRSRRSICHASSPAVVKVGFHQLIFSIIFNSDCTLYFVGERGESRPEKTVRMFWVARWFRPMVESIRYKNSPYTTHTAFKAPTIRKAMLRQMSRRIHQECKSLCSTKGQKSILRKGFVEDVNSFKWKRLSCELHSWAPTLNHALKAACVCPGKKRAMSFKRVLPMAAAVLLRGRNKFLCMSQTIISTILYTRHCSKMVCTISTIIILVHL